MTRQDIIDSMTHNAKGMIAMGTETGDMEMALIGHATLTAIVSIQNGNGAEFSMAMIAFHHIMEEKNEMEREAAQMPEGIETMLNELGIVTAG